MKCYVEVVSTPTSDTPGTLLVLHYDDRRYLIGNLSEGTSRACLQHGLAMRKVNEVLLTGRCRWSNIGGMLGMVLGLADMKKAAAEAQNEHHRATMAEKERRQKHGSGQPSDGHMRNDTNGATSIFLRMHGPPNLNYAIATARRFIFRTGMPIIATEHSASDAPQQSDKSAIPPTWTDEHLQVWSMPLLPSISGPRRDMSSPERPPSRKRSFNEMREGDLDAVAALDSVPKRIVQQMFNSDWRMDKLIKRPLKDVEMPATIFVRDPATRNPIPYTGPTPGSGKPVPDIMVEVRQPWPGAMADTLPDAKPSQESMCYIIRNHPQRGKFLPQKAKELRVDKLKFQELTNGTAVQNMDGQEITPDMVLEPGKKGGGFAVVEIPSDDYVEDMMSRPEWVDESVMGGVEAIIWVLGPGVLSNSLLTKFRERFANLKQFIASPDLREDRLALETAAKSAWRHHNQEGDVFPTLLSDRTHLSKHALQHTLGRTDEDVIAPRGLVLSLEPQFQVEKNTIVEHVDETQLLEGVKNEHKRMLAETSDATMSDNPVSGNEPTDPSWHTSHPYDNIEITTLGTGSSHPSTHRNVSSTLLRIPGCGSYLFDCGEGTLGTLRRMYDKPQLDSLFADLKMIWISHMHADHHLGTTSVIRAWYEAVYPSNSGPETHPADPILSESEKPRLAVVSEPAMLRFLRELSNIDDFGYPGILPLSINPTRNVLDPDLATRTLLRCTNLEENIDYDEATTNSYLKFLGLANISSVYVPHCRGAQAVSLTFSVPSTKSDGPSHTVPFKISYSGDTRPSRHFAHIGKDSHVLIHEATFDDDMRGEALAKRHSTAGEALTVAKEMQAKAVVLTHFSQRYPKMSGGGPVGGRGGTNKLKEKGIELNKPFVPPSAGVEHTGTSGAPQEQIGETKSSENGGQMDVSGDTENENKATIDPSTSANNSLEAPTTTNSAQPNPVSAHIEDNQIPDLASAHVEENENPDPSSAPLQDNDEPDPVAQPWSLPLTASKTSRTPLDLRVEYEALLSHPSGLRGAIADLGIKVVPAFDYMRLKLGNLDKAVQVQGMLRALEEFAEKERAREREKALEEERKKLEDKQKAKKERAKKLGAKKERKLSGGKEGKEKVKEVS